jgi:hypothetical protein
VSPFSHLSSLFCRKAEERAASRASFDTAPSAVKVASVVWNSGCRVWGASCIVSLRFAVLPGLAVTVAQVGAVLDIKPTFDAYMNDAWRVRKEVRSSPRRRTSLQF